MATLRQMAALTSGLYRDGASGRAYREDDLLAQLPDEVLSRPIRVERQERGIYRIHVANGSEREFLLLSRRKQSRASRP